MIELEPHPADIESMHLAGQLELQFCIEALSGVINQHPELEWRITPVQDRLLDRWNSLNIVTS